MSCLDEVNTYMYVSWFAVALSFINILAIRVALPRMMGVRLTSPLFLQCAARFLFCTAVLKIVIGVVLLTVLYPIDCDNVFVYYPYIVLFLGIMWLLRSYTYYRIGIKLSQNPAAQPAVAYATPVAVVVKAPYNSMA